jgi:DNA-3-methyladenine glycosylase II
MDDRSPPLTDASVRAGLMVLGHRHPAVARAVERVGVPTARRRPEGFGTLAHIVIGQQLSTRAAATIGRRVTETVGGMLTAQAVSVVSDDDLRTAGLSRQKVSYLRALSAAVDTGALPVNELSERGDREVVEAITAVRGFGEWSAQMYLLFSLGRSDVWPSGDLAVRGGFGRLLGMVERPSPRQTRQDAEPFRPYRSALALLCWRLYSEAPL